jgi:uncharacterized membrane protein HdeD (DUF308 family)
MKTHLVVGSIALVVGIILIVLRRSLDRWLTPWAIEYWQSMSDSHRTYGVSWTVRYYQKMVELARKEGFGTTVFAALGVVYIVIGFIFLCIGGT